MNVETANKLMKHRKQLGLSQEELAEKIGVSRQAVSKWERAESSPDTDNLIALSKIYNISIDEMLGYNIDSNKESADSQFKDEDASMLKQLGVVPVGSITIILFLILGLAFNLWHPAWVLFLAVPFMFLLRRNSLKKSKEERMSGWRILPFPIFIFIAFIVLIAVYDWQWAWLLFLTIPIWSYIVSKK